MAAVTGVTLNLNTISLDISQHGTLVATVLPEDADNKNVTWTSSDEGKVTVTQDGIISPQSNGTAIITVTTEDGGFTDTCEVTVTTDVTGIVLNKNNIKIAKGETGILVVTLSPSTATPKPITWSSSDIEIATVSNGAITGVKSGSCIITASVQDSHGTTFSANCNTSIVVYPTGISLDPAVIEQHVIDETPDESIEVIFDPETTTEKEITWTSTNSDICIYDKTINKIVYKGDIGTCYLTATDEVGNMAICEINVYKRKPKPNIPIVELITEHTISLEYLDNYVYSINGGISWSFSSTFENLETNFTYYLNQKELGNGYYLESEPSDCVEVTTKDIVHVESVTLNTHELRLEVGDDPYLFEVTIEPEDAAIKNVFYNFNNTAIGTMNNNELIPRNGGAGIVTVTSIDGGKTDTCNVKIYKKYETPAAPVIEAITNYSVTLRKDSPYQRFAMVTNGTIGTWQEGNVFDRLTPRKDYSFVTKLISNGYNLESDVSESINLLLPASTPVAETISDILLNANNLYFDINKNRYATLAYTIVPTTVTSKDVVYYSTDSSIVSVNGAGELKANNVGSCTITVQPLISDKRAYCKCYVYETQNIPNPPTLKEAKVNSIELNPVSNCEYSIDGETWQNETLFENLAEDSYYNFYQRYKAIGDYQPPSESSRALTVKTLPRSKPSDVSPSGYRWGQEVEVNKIPVYPSPYGKKSNFKVTGKYYIFDVHESNHRIRITKHEQFIDVPGHQTGWVNIADLKLIVDELYVGDRVIVTGNINTNADGSGTAIHKDKAEMYITDIIGMFEYGYAVTDKPGKMRIGFAKRDMIVKYENTVIVNE